MKTVRKSHSFTIQTVSGVNVAPALQSVQSRSVSGELSLKCQVTLRVSNEFQLDSDGPESMDSPLCGGNSLIDTISHICIKTHLWQCFTVYPPLQSELDNLLCFVQKSVSSWLMPETKSFHTRGFSLCSKASVPTSVSKNPQKLSLSAHLTELCRAARHMQQIQSYARVASKMNCTASLRLLSFFSLSQSAFNYHVSTPPRWLLPLPLPLPLPERKATPKQQISAGHK